MQQWTYLGMLIAMLSGLAVVDFRLRLAFFNDWRRAARVVVLGVLVFLAWDLLGIHFSIFFPGASPYDLGLMLAPKLPVEELFFLCSLNYLTLLLWRIGERYADVFRTR